MKPILFEIAGFHLHSFGLMVALGFIVGTWISTRRAIAVGLDPNAIQDLVFPWLLIGGIVGARVLYVISYWNKDFAGRPWTEIFALWNGGLVFYGGLIGATVAGIIAVIRKNLPLWVTADCLMPGVAIGHVFGRVGCLLNGCCFGRTCEVPWALHFPKDHPTAGMSVHPAQLYEAGLNLALCGFLIWWHQKRRSFEGQVFAIYLIAYSFIRAFSEYFRGDYSKISSPAQGVFTPGQSTSVLILAAGIGVWIYLRARKQPAPSN